MMAAIFHFMKKHKFIILVALIFSVTVAVLGYYIYTLQTENHSLRIHLQSAKIENHNLLELLYNRTQYFKAQLKSIENTNQRLTDDKKKLKEELNQSTTELQFIKESNKKLIDEQKKLQKKIYETSTQLKSNKSKLQRWLKDKIVMNKAYHDAYSTQVLHLQTWTESIGKLEENLYAIVHGIAELHNREVIIKIIYLIVKYTRQCKKYLDTVSLKKTVKEMQALQPNSTDIDKEMEKINEEVNHIKHQINEEEKAVVINNYNVYEPSLDVGLGDIIDLGVTALEVAGYVEYGYWIGKGIGWVANKVWEFIW